MVKPSFKFLLEMIDQLRLCLDRYMRRMMCREAKKKRPIASSIDDFERFVGEPVGEVLAGMPPSRCGM